MNRQLGTKMNRQLGTKWFTFYAKIRPWLACFSSLTLIVDFFQYMDIYFSYWWMLLYFLTGIAQPVLAIMVFAKSEGDYGDFVRFVKGVLIYETICIPFHQGVKQYLENDYDLSIALVVFCVFLIVFYFLWYRLNIKYFEKRILIEEPETVSCDFTSVSRPSKISDPNEVPKTNGNYNVYGDDIRLQTEEKKKVVDDATEVTSKVQFCRKCGNKLPEDAFFCTKCGTKITTEEKQGE